jgi:lipopolysaccharide transport system permease protein
VAVDTERSAEPETASAAQASAERARPNEEKPTGATQARVTVIRPASRWPSLDLGELFHYRELLATFVWRDVKVRYKQTSIGVAWALLQPFLTMVVMTLVFGKFAKFPSQNLPYPVFLYSALLPWTYFQAAVSQGSSCLVSNVSLVTKVYFPRVLLPFAAILTPLVDFLLASVILAGLMLWYKVPPGDALYLAPVFLLLCVVTALGTALFLAAVNVRYRDVPYVVPFVLQIWQFISSVFYPVADLPEKWQWVLALNPLTAAIGGFRWTVVGTPPPHLGQFLVSLAMAGVFIIVGLGFFRRSEPKFADTI